MNELREKNLRNGMDFWIIKCNFKEKYTVMPTEATSKPLKIFESWNITTKTTNCIANTTQTNTNLHQSKTTNNKFTKNNFFIKLVYCINYKYAWRASKIM